MAATNRIKEEWRAWAANNSRFAGRYEVSSLGRVRSVARVVSREWARRGRPHKMRVGGNLMRGHVRVGRSGRPVAVMVTLRDCFGKPHCVRLHRMVLEAFVGPCPEGMECCHNNGNPVDNRLSNLRWDTHAANHEDMREHGTESAPPLHLGEKHPNSKLNFAAVREIRGTPKYRGMAAHFSRKFGISDTHVIRIWRGEGWHREP